VKTYVTEKPVTFLHETNHVCAVAGLPTLSSSKQARKKTDGSHIHNQTKCRYY